MRILTQDIYFQVKYKEMVQELEHPTAGRIRVPGMYVCLYVGYQANCSNVHVTVVSFAPVNVSNSCEGNH